MTTSLHPAAPHHLPPFITAPGETDILMVVMAVFLVVAVLAVGILFLRLHTLPERMAHKSHKLQFEIVAVLGLLALFTHMHIFWVAGLLLALIDLPDFGRPLNRIAGSLERIAGLRPEEGSAEEAGETSVGAAPGEGAVEMPTPIIPARMPKERIHA
jgi:NADH:ubiquinone oxidoreductase subunit 5 (subunit L)/multisubunit Na+/H+ antiporter MnhA subunit